MGQKNKKELDFPSSSSWWPSNENHYIIRQLIINFFKNWFVHWRLYHSIFIHVFVHADKAFRLERIINNYGFDPADAEAQMMQKDRERINFSKYYAHRAWGHPDNYHMTVDSSTFGIDIAAALLVDAWRKAVALAPENETNLN